MVALLSFWELVFANMYNVFPETRQSIQSSDEEAEMLELIASVDSSISIEVPSLGIDKDPSTCKYVTGV